MYSSRRVACVRSAVAAPSSDDWRWSISKRKTFFVFGSCFTLAAMLKLLVSLLPPVRVSPPPKLAFHAGSGAGVGDGAGEGHGGQSCAARGAADAIAHTTARIRMTFMARSIQAAGRGTTAGTGCDRHFT